MQTVVDHLPKVTGSEGDMDIYIVRAYGHNMWSNRDEFHNLSRGFKTQSRYFLVLDGHLRDRMELVYVQYVMYLKVFAAVNASL